MATPAQIAACAANAQTSPSPRPSSKQDGRDLSQQPVHQAARPRAVGLYAQADILPGEDPAAFEQLARAFEDEYQPQSPDEIRLLNDLVRAIWLERRYTRIETEVINLRFATLSEEERQHPLGAIYIKDAEGPNLLPKIERRRAAAQRQADRARIELRRLKVGQALPPVQASEARPTKPLPSDSVRFDKPASTPPITSGPTPFRTPRDNWDNPALRL